jgi:hypothetical protein
MLTHNSNIGRHPNVMPVLHTFIDTPPDAIDAKPSSNGHTRASSRALFVVSPVTTISLARLLHHRINNIHTSSTSGNVTPVKSNGTGMAAPLLSEAEVLHIGRQVSSALLHLHRCRIVHRDCSPLTLQLVCPSLPSSSPSSASISSSTPPPATTTLSSPTSSSSSSSNYSSSTICRSLVLLSDFALALDIDEQKLHDFRVPFTSLDIRVGGGGSSPSSTQVSSPSSSSTTSSNSSTNTSVPVWLCQSNWAPGMSNITNAWC